MTYRQTLAAPAVCAGIGLHSGERVRMVLQPASAGSGIRFVRSDIGDRDNRIAARADAVSEVRLGTTLQNDAGVTIATVEHLMAALAGLGVDDAVIEVDGPEIPVMDGSSEPFVKLIRQVGLKSQSVPRRAIQVLKPLCSQSVLLSTTWLPMPCRPRASISTNYDKKTLREIYP